MIFMDLMPCLTVYVSKMGRTFFQKKSKRGKFWSCLILILQNVSIIYCIHSILVALKCVELSPPGNGFFILTFLNCELPSRILACANAVRKLIRIVSNALKCIEITYHYSGKKTDKCAN